MTQRSIEAIIGRLSTDEEFRHRFAKDPRGTLAELVEWGTHLTAVEIAALTATDSEMWNGVAHQIDPRLQKPTPNSTAPK